MPRIALTTGATGGSSRRAATHYGPRDIEQTIGAAHASVAGETTLTTTFTFDDLPVAGLDALIPRIAGRSHIKKATLRILEAFVGGTTVTIGLETTAGGTIDADGIDATIATAVIDAVGDTVNCDGALVGLLVGIGAADANVVVTTAGTYTAGKAVLEIVYAELYDRAASQINSLNKLGELNGFPFFIGDIKWQDIKT